jgi:hypothetical protein
MTMLTVTNEQFQAMRQARTERYARDLLTRLHIDYPELIPSVENRGELELVCSYLSRARSMGFTSDRDLRAFVLLKFAVSRQWEEFPAIVKLLGRARLSGTNGIAVILRALDTEDWHIVRKWSRIGDR